MTPLIFDHSLLRKRRTRAALRFSDHDFLFQDMADRVVERLEEFGRYFDTGLDLGCHSGQLAQALESKSLVASLVQTELSEPLIMQAKGQRIVASEEALPFAPASFDVIMSVGALHWVNDLPGTLIQIHHALKPGGLFLAIFPGGRSLWELREAVINASIAQEGGVHARLSPFIDPREAAALMQRAGFSEPIVDVDQLTVTYADAYALMRDLRGMAETNALYAQSKHLTRRHMMQEIARQYQGIAKNGRIPATFELVTMTGWKA